jgi:uncharacterized surface protein with fasciclin (FAS1) repeats
MRIRKQLWMILPVVFAITACGGGKQQATDQGQEGGEDATSMEEKAAEEQQGQASGEQGMDKMEDETSMQEEASGEEKPSKNIVQLAASTDQLKTLTECVKIAGLGGALQAEGPYTVFAPTDKAFGQIPKEKRDKLMNEKTDQLAGILKYHVVKGKHKMEDLPGKTLTTLQGNKLSFSKKNGYVMINGKVAITAENQKASNGMVHIINSVLVPKQQAG